MIRRVPALAAWGAGLAGLAQVALLAAIFVQRIGYPLDLEWEEGGMLAHALRLVEGQSLYAEPSVEFISFLYTPFFPALLAALGALFGVSYALGRAVSIACFAAVLALAVLAVRRQAGRGATGLAWGLAAAGLAAASFPHVGAWHDLVRNDSCFLALVVGGLYLVLHHHDRYRWLVTSGVLLGLAFLTKQTATLFILYAGFALLLLDWRRLPVLVVTVGVVAGGTVLVLNHVTQGWFWRFVFEMHQGHDFSWWRALQYTPKVLLEASPVAAALLALWLVVFCVGLARRRRLRPTDRGALYWLGAALTGIAASCVGFGTQWAAENAFIPGLVLPAIFAGVAAVDLVARTASWLARPWATAGVGLALAGALGAQLVLQLYSPARHVPTDADRAAARALLARLRSFDGPVLVPYHPWYPWLAGQRPHFHQMGINDVTRAGFPYPKGIRERILAGHYAAIVLDNPPQGRYDYALGPYRVAEHLAAAESPRVLTGYAVRPRYLLLPRRDAR